MLPFAIAMLILPQIGQWLGRYLASHQILALGLSVVCLGNLVTAWGAAGSWWPLLILGMIILGSGGGLLNGDTQKAIMGVVPRERAGMASGISTTSRFSGILLGFVVLSTIMAIVARAALTTSICASIASHCEVATEFARLVAAGDVPKAVALMADDRQRDCSPRLCHGLRGRAAYRRRRRRSFRCRGRNPNAVGEGPVIFADCVRRRRRGALRKQTDRQRGLRPSSAARLRRNTDPRRSCRGD